MVEALVCKTFNTRFESSPVLHVGGAAEWSASGLENRGLVMSQWSSILPSSANIWKSARSVMVLFAKQRMRLTAQAGSIPATSANMESGQTRSVGDGCNPFCLFAGDRVRISGSPPFHARVAQRQRLLAQTQFSGSSNLPPGTMCAYANRQSVPA